MSEFEVVDQSPYPEPRHRSSKIRPLSVAFRDMAPSQVLLFQGDKAERQRAQRTLIQYAWHHNIRIRTWTASDGTLCVRKLAPEVGS